VSFGAPYFFATMTLPGGSGVPGAGDLDLVTTLPGDPALRWLHIYLQEFAEDPAAVQEVSMSNALDLFMATDGGPWQEVGHRGKHLPMSLLALTRAIPPSISRCELTHLERNTDRRRARLATARAVRAGTRGARVHGAAHRAGAGAARTRCSSRMPPWWWTRWR
jgi:hypothetical protein